MNRNNLIKCPKCKTLYRIPITDKLLKITCRECNHIFYNKKIPIKKNNKFILLSITAITLIVFGWFIINPEKRDSLISKIKSSNWVTISYSGLIDNSVLTHSGETVHEVINKIPNYSDEIKGLVQQYLEPYSELCHQILLASTNNDNVNLINIIDNYPIGSNQPAWVALFREGHYQLYYNKNIIRVFTKGKNPELSYNQNYSIIRHPINDILASKSTNIQKIEIYVFSNNYSTCELRLNTIPYILYPKDLSDSANQNVLLSPKHNSINLEGLKYFFEQNVILEAIEIDDNNNLYLYGRKADKKQTLSNNPISLSDFAVIYRSIFHCGNNSPYISLDNHEDNRYAKVNFGGLLENTFVGNVVLEADKLFKTLSTGLDPNTHNLIKSNITNSVPNFLTEDERNLLDNFGDDHMQIRYWFYPDSIITVTDGSIGAVQKYQFLADIERMDAKISVGNAVRKTIDHLNNNYSQYEKVFHTFKELSNVGRLMALVNWLKYMRLDNRVELDDLLSVMIPACTTPIRTKKMLAITTIAYPSNSNLTEEKVRNLSKVYDISELLDQYSYSTSDEKFLSISENYYSKIDISELAPPIYNQILSESEYYDNIITSNEIKINDLDNKIKVKESKLDRYNAESIKQFNYLVDNYNNLLKKQEVYINSYNAKIKELNNLNMVTNYIASIGGGINLEPTYFKVISCKTNSQIQKIKEIKSALLSSTSKNNDKWIRSNSEISGSTINELPENYFKNVSSKNNNKKYTFSSKGNHFVFYKKAM